MASNQDSSLGDVRVDSEEESRHEASLEPTQSTVDWVARKRRKHWMLLTIGLLAVGIMRGLEVKDYSRFTSGAKIVAVIVAIVSYLVMLGAVAFVGAWIWRDTRRYWFGALAWLMFLAGLCDVLTHRWTVTQ